MKIYWSAALEIIVSIFILCVTLFSFSPMLKECATQLRNFQDCISQVEQTVTSMRGIVEQEKKQIKDAKDIVESAQESLKELRERKGIIGSLIRMLCKSILEKADQSLSRAKQTIDQVKETVDSTQCLFDALKASLDDISESLNKVFLCIKRLASGLLGFSAALCVFCCGNGLLLFFDRTKQNVPFGRYIFSTRGKAAIPLLFALAIGFTVTACDSKNQQPIQKIELIGEVDSPGIYRFDIHSKDSFKGTFYTWKPYKGDKTEFDCYNGVPSIFLYLPEGKFHVEVLPKSVKDINGTINISEKIQTKTIIPDKMVNSNGEAYLEIDLSKVSFPQAIYRFQPKNLELVTLTEEKLKPVDPIDETGTDFAMSSDKKYFVKMGLKQRHSVSFTKIAEIIDVSDHGEGLFDLKINGSMKEDAETTVKNTSGETKKIKFKKEKPKTQLFLSGKEWAVYRAEEKLKKDNTRFLDVHLSRIDEFHISPGEDPLSVSQKENGEIYIRLNAIEPDVKYDFLLKDFSAPATVRLAQVRDMELKNVKKDSVKAGKLIMFRKEIKDKSPYYLIISSKTQNTFSVSLKEHTKR